MLTSSVDWSRERLSEARFPLFLDGSDVGAARVSPLGLGLGVGDPVAVLVSGGGAEVALSGPVGEFIKKEISITLELDIFRALGVISDRQLIIISSMESAYRNLVSQTVRDGQLSELADLLSEWAEKRSSREHRAGNEPRRDSKKEVLLWDEVRVRPGRDIER